ncbi:MAG: lytic murein transglycosylase [Hyphomicrobiales bacterium]
MLLRLLLVLMLACIAALPVRASDDRAAAFRQWLEGEFWPKAEASGITRATFDKALRGVEPDFSLPDLVKPGGGPPPSLEKQPEFGSPGRYFPQKSLDRLAGLGRAKAKSDGAALKSIETATGVPGPVVLAIWGRETAFSGVDVPHDAFAVLATQAFTGRRKEKFADELLGALTILQDGYADRGEMKSSWAGAMGFTQVLPSYYLTYRADGDGDGRVDIWTSEADALATTANFLKQKGWVRGLPYAWEVALPPSVSCTLEGPDQGKALKAWAALGLKRVDGKPWPASLEATEMYLVAPAGRFGPAFLATKNFYVIKEYNESDLYVLYIGTLADRIAGAGSGFRTPWRDVDTYRRTEMLEVQKKLKALGYDIGDRLDGLVGFRMRRATGRFQEKAGAAADCWPNRSWTEKILGAK